MADRLANDDFSLVRDFVNTVNLQDGPDELTDQNTLQAWLVARGLLRGSDPVGGSDVKHAVALREAMRGVIGGNTGSTVYPVDVATLNEAAAASGLRMRFAPDGRARLEPETSGVVGALGRIVASFYAAMHDPGWTRLKLCRDQTCRWAFFDHSKNHSGRWCDMASCGNRAKARRFRSQAKHHA